MAANQLPQMSITFQCKSCETEKGANEFYASNLSRCKECVKASVRSNRSANSEYYLAYDRKRYRDQPKRKDAAKRSAQSKAGIESRKRSADRLRAEHPEKLIARSAVSNALRSGRLERGTECFFCDASETLHAHHEDYDHPLDVVWLCPSCHGKLHTIKGDFRRTEKP